MASHCKTVLVIAAAVAVAALLPGAAFAVVYRVGDADGWNKLVDYKAWADGKNFKDGDILEFVYQPGIHDVVIGDADSYRACTIPPENDSTWLSSGDDTVLLEGAGHHYFMSLVEDDCEDGVKLHVVTTY